MDSVYLESTIPSYLTAERSRDLVIAANQQLTAEWWKGAREHFELVTSEVVLEEIGDGDPAMAGKRIELVRDLPSLILTAEALSVAHLYERKLGLAENARTDILHIALAVVYEIDYLLTWNCKHIANGSVRRRLRRLNLEHGLWIPTIVTPIELPDPTPGETP